MISSSNKCDQEEESIGVAEKSSGLGGGCGDFRRDWVEMVTFRLRSLQQYMARHGMI